MNSNWWWLIPVLLVLAVLQTAVLSRLPIYGLTLNLVFLVVLAWGLLHGLNDGIALSFVAGLLLDLFSVSPMGITSLAMMTAVFAAIWVQQALPQERFFLPLALAGFATLVFLFVYFLFLRLLSQPAAFAVLMTRAPLALLHTAVFLPVYWLLYALDRTLRPRPVQF